MLGCRFYHLPLYDLIFSFLSSQLIGDHHFILQAQMRDLTGFVETRQQLLTLKPNHRMNWIGFAVSQHLNSKYASSEDIHNKKLLNIVKFFMRCKLVSCQSGLKFPFHLHASYIVHTNLGWMKKVSSCFP